MPTLFRRRLLIALLLVGIAVVGWTSAQPADPPAVSTRVGYTFSQAKLMGNLSCSAASCHAAGDDGKPGSEYSTWVNSDSHYRAYDVLRNEASQRIAAILDVRKDGKLVPAHENQNCLRCHAPDISEQRALPLSSHGVGCESCHGPAEKWLTTHYQDSFKALSRHEKAERFGLYPTKDLAFRVSQCASCHVGDATREVNHDLLAAGHPRLAFEYTGFHRSPKYVPHWRETEYGPDFEARAWQIGQVACARAAVDLLQARASKKESPWPELSEHGCFACHKDLTNNAWKPLVTSARTPGVMPWGTWYFSTLELAVEDREIVAEVQRLARLMESPGKNRTSIAAAAGSLSKRLDARLIALQRAADQDSKVRPFDGRRLQTSFTLTNRHALTDDGSRFRDADWDGATQHYLAAAAIYYGWGEADASHRDARYRRPLTDLGRSLTFPKGYNSPKDADPATILNLFQQLRSEHPGAR
jgi:hypothetical protein